MRFTLRHSRYTTYHTIPLHRLLPHVGELAPEEIRPEGGPVLRPEGDGAHEAGSGGFPPAAGGATPGLRPAQAVLHDARPFSGSDQPSRAAKDQGGIGEAAGGILQPLHQPPEEEPESKVEEGAPHGRPLVLVQFR